MEKSPKFFTPTRLAAVLFIIVAIIGGLLYYASVVQKESTMKSFNTEVRNTVRTYASGDYTTSIKTFGDLLKDAPDKMSEARLKLLIGINLWRRNEGDDRAKAIGYYQRIVDDYSLPASYRAQTVAEMASLFQNEDASFFRANAVSPFDAYLRETGQRFDVLRAVLRVYEYSDELFPNFLAEYGLAYVEGSLLVNKALPAGVSEKETAQLIQKYIKEADEKMAKADRSWFLPSVFAQQYLLKARMMALAERILGNVHTEDREKDYQLALKKSQTNSPNQPIMREVEMNTRFYYAVFLELNFGKVGSRTKDIVELMKPFASATKDSPLYALTRSNFSKLGQQPSGDFVRSQALEVARISPEFKAFLLSVGWKL